MQRLHRARLHYSLLTAASLPLLFGTRPSRADEVREAPTLPDAPSPVEPTPDEPPAPPDAAPVSPPAAAPAPTPSDAPKAPSAGAFPSSTTTPDAKANPAPAHAAQPAKAHPAKAQPATAASAAPVAATTKPPPEPESQADDSGGIFGPIRLGILVGVGLPGVLNFGGTLKLTRFFGAGINIGIIPTAQISFYGEAKLAYQEYDAYGRIYPFGGGFFLGAGVGYMHAQGSLKENFSLSGLQIPPGLLPPGYVLPDSVEYTSSGSVRAMVLTPQIGYLHTFGSGFSVGFDLGAQIPIAPSEISVQSTIKPKELAQLPEFQQTEKEVRDTLEKVGATPLPTINFRIGWLL